MATPLESLTSRLDEIQVDLAFLANAAKLRPRLADIIDWKGHAETIELARSFMGIRDSRPESFVAALLVRVVAAFERYMRQLVEVSVDKLCGKAQSFDDVSDALRRRNLALTGRVIATMDSPKDYQVFNYDQLISNLASCTAGSKKFRLNASAFSAVVTGSSPENIERALKVIDVDGWWDAVGAESTLQKMLSTKRARETGLRAKERLKELSKWRNQIAHAGDEEVSLSPDQLVEVISFLKCFATCLDGVVSKRTLPSKHSA